MKEKPYIKYLLFMIFKTVMTFPFLGGAIHPFIVGWSHLGETATNGAIMCIPVAIYLTYDWIKSFIIPFRKEGYSSTSPVFWEGGGFRDENKR